MFEVGVGFDAGVAAAAGADCAAGAGACYNAIYRAKIDENSITSRVRCSGIPFIRYSTALSGLPNAARRAATT